MQKIPLHQAGDELRIMLAEVFDALAVDFGSIQVDIVAFEQKLRQHARSASHLEHRPATVGTQRAGDTPCDGQVGQEMLTQVFFRSYVHSILRYFASAMPVPAPASVKSVRPPRPPHEAKDQLPSSLMNLIRTKRISSSVKSPPNSLIASSSESVSASSLK